MPAAKENLGVSLHCHSEGEFFTREEAVGDGDRQRHREIHRERNRETGETHRERISGDMWKEVMPSAKFQSQHEVT